MPCKFEKRSRITNPEDGNCSVCRNAVQLRTFNMSYKTRKPRFILYPRIVFDRLFSALYLLCLDFGGYLTFNGMELLLAVNSKG
jgi:hypothetical protein